MTKKTFSDAVSSVLNGADPDRVADELLATVKPTPAPTVKKITIGSVVSEMLTSTDMAYDAIVDAITKQFPKANTTSRSIASVAARLRKTGVEVPTRRKAKVVGDAA